MRIKIAVSFLVTLFTLAFCMFSASASDDFDSLRLKWREVLVGVNDEANSSAVTAKINGITNSANYNWQRMVKTESRAYLFPEYSSNIVSSHITGTYGILHNMATAYSTKGSALYQNQQLKNDLLNSLDWMFQNRYNYNSTEYDNWWDWEIGTPKILNNIIILMYDDLGTQRITNYTNAIEHFSPDPTKCYQPSLFESTAANRLSMCMVVGLRGIIVKDSSKVEQAEDALSPVFPFTSRGDGFYRDGSFIQHDRHPYNGGYGLSMMEDLSSLLYLFNNSQWQINDPNKDNVYEWIRNAYLPIVYDGIIMDAVTGRNASRSYNSTYCASSLLKTAVMLSETATAGEGQFLLTVAKAWITKNTLGNLYNDATIFILKKMEKIAADSSISPWERTPQNKQYSNMDRVVHNRKNFAFSVSMSSNRIYNFESILSENLKGWYTSDGMTYLYNSDPSQYTDAFWPTVNPYRLAGTTVAVRNRTNGVGSSYRSPKYQVGGASLDGVYGSACMELKAYGVSLEAKKSWFMFDNEIMALGAGINSTDNMPIETVIDNRMLNPAASNTLTVDGQTAPADIGWSSTLSNASWLHLSGKTPNSDMGYYLPDGGNVKALRESRAGSWNDINSSGSTAIYTRNYLNLWFDHGTNPQNGNYAYVLLPNKTAEQTEAYAANPDVEIIQNSPDLQAVRNNKLGITGITFWKDEPQTADGITCNQKASVMVRRSETEISLGVSDPTHLNNGTIEIQLAQPADSLIYAPSNVQVISLYPSVRLLVNVAGSAGETYNIKLGLSENKYLTLVNLDDGISLSSFYDEHTISQDGSVIFRSWSGNTPQTKTTVVGQNESGNGFDKISIKQSAVSMYKDNFLLTPSVSFSKDKLTAIELKYSVALQDNSVADKPSVKINLALPSISVWDVGTGNIDITQQSDEYKTLLIIIDPLSKKVFCSNDGRSFASYNFGKDLTTNINDARLYLVAKPTSGNPTDGVTPLVCPVNWTFDSIKISEISPGDLFIIKNFYSSNVGGNVQFSLCVENNEPNSRNAFVAVAAYRKDESKLLFVKVYKISELLFGEEFSVSDCLGLASGTDAIKVKVFLWDSENNAVPIDIRSKLIE